MAHPFLGSVFALIRKDLLMEWRSKDVVSGGLVFALLILVVFNFAFDLQAENLVALAPGVLWITFIFAGMLGIGRSFAIERDRGTLEGLLLAPIDRSALYVAKTITNVALMGTVELAAFPVFVALFNVRAGWLDVTLVAILGTVGFAGVGTLSAAMAASTRAREIMLPLLLLPLEVPVVIASVKATGVALGAQPADTLPWFQLLVGFDVILVAAAILVFEYILEE